MSMNLSFQLLSISDYRNPDNSHNYEMVDVVVWPQPVKSSKVFNFDF